MASLSTDPNGNRMIQFVAADKKRATIRIGKMSLKAAESIKATVESLLAAKVSQTAWDLETATWIRNLDPKLHDKLAKVGLLPARAKSDAVSLGEFHCLIHQRSLRCQSVDELGLTPHATMPD